MRKHQHGITLVGWLILLLPMAIVIYAGIRLSTVYLNYMKVKHSLDAVRSEVSNATAGTADALRRDVERHFEIESVDYPSVKDLKITRNDGVWSIEANYDDQTPLFSNLAILVTFDKTIVLKNEAGE